MSEETKKREREERRRREIEQLMQSMERTAPKADADLLRSLQGIELSEGGVGQPRDKPRDLGGSIHIELKKEEADLESAFPAAKKVSDAIPLSPAKATPGESGVSPNQADPEPAAESPGEEVLVLQKPEPSTVEAV